MEESGRRYVIPALWRVKMTGFGGQEQVFTLTAEEHGGGAGGVQAVHDCGRVALCGE